MTEPTLRPSVAEMLFQLYGQPAHPELFDILATRAVEHLGYQARVSITRAGHVISWRRGDVVLTEILHADPGLTLSRRLLNYRIRGEHRAKIAPRPGIVYQSSFQVETLEPDVFHHIHAEILADGRRRGMLYHFCPHQRITVTPVGFLNMEAKPGCLFFSSFHTFPEENTVVKSQSLIEMA